MGRARGRAVEHGAQVIYGIDKSACRGDLPKVLIEPLPIKVDCLRTIAGLGEKNVALIAKFHPSGATRFQMLGTMRFHESGTT
jgi:hypothetical protein